MPFPVRILGFCLLALLMASCATSQSRYAMLDKSFSPRPEGWDVQVFQNTAPSRPYLKISRLDVHLEKVFFLGSSLDGALPELKRQARLSGADAVIELQENRSMVGETRIYHVTATGIRYTDAP